MSGVQLLEVAHSDGDQRFDRWLRQHFPDLRQGQIEKLCRKGHFRIDGGRVKPNTRVQSGQQVRVPPLPDTPARQGHDRGDKPKLSITPADRDMMQSSVIYRDEHLIAINKMAGLSVQGGSKQTRYIDALSAALVDEGMPKPKLVHRLDRDTSGVMILALTAQAARGLAHAFKSRAARKIYWAAVAGVPKPRAGCIRYGLLKSAAAGQGEKMQIIHPDLVAQHQGAKHASSDYMVIEALANRASWVALLPISGRTHQLRAHMAAIGHPIVGDGKYGTNAQINQGDGWGAQLGGSISRKLHLHARYLSLIHPMTGAPLTLSAALPDHMQRTWDAFDWNGVDPAPDPFAQDAQ